MRKSVFEKFGQKTISETGGLKSELQWGPQGMSYACVVGDVRQSATDSNGNWIIGINHFVTAGAPKYAQNSVMKTKSFRSEKSGWTRLALFGLTVMRRL